MTGPDPGPRVEQFGVQHPDFEDFWMSPGSPLDAHRTRTNRPDLDAEAPVQSPPTPPPPPPRTD